MIRVEVICDRQTSRSCHSTSGSRHFRPAVDTETASHGARVARDMAKTHGWITKRQPMRTPATAYICPACQQP